jgi:radical SAM protein with 4Fe4S-binding SPASM domain
MYDKQLVAPLCVDFNITKRCNLKCHFCYASAIEENGISEMTLEEIDKAFESFNALNIHVVRISGGEPYMRRDICNIIDLTEKYNFSVCLNTNGTLLADKEISHLKRSKVVSVGVSLDGPTCTVHEALRGVEGAYEKTLTALKRMKNALEDRLCVTYTITNKNCDVKVVEETLNLIHSMGISKVSFQLTSPVGRGDHCVVSAPSYVQWKTLFLWLNQYKKEQKMCIGVHPTNEAPVFWEFYLPLLETNQLSDLSSVWKQDASSNVNKCSTCRAGTSVIAIASNGDVYPCELMLSYEVLCVGNIEEKSFKSIWNDSPLLQSLSQMKLNSIGEPCASCTNHFCGGGCRAVAYALHQDLFGLDNRCPLIGNCETKGEV